MAEIKDDVLDRMENIPLQVNVQIDHLYSEWHKRYLARYGREPNSYYSFRAGYLLLKIYRGGKEENG
jgi:hypothetical protein